MPEDRCFGMSLKERWKHLTIACDTDDLVRWYSVDAELFHFHGCTVLRFHNVIFSQIISTHIPAPWFRYHNVSQYSPFFLIVKKTFTPLSQVDDTMRSRRRR